MRGGAQAHLVEAEDGHFYVVKAKNNPQHRRILVNEWICSVFLRYLQVSAAEPSFVAITPGFLAENPSYCHIYASNPHPIEPGWTFGSRFPGHPDRIAVFDYLPDPLLLKTANLRDFIGALVFDKWTSNADSRQAVFFRAQLRQPGEDESPAAARLAYVAMMIDNGFAFDGPNWKFNNSPLQGLYHRRKIYDSIRSWGDFEPWISRVEHFPEAVVDQAAKQIPPDWLEGDESALESMFERLLARRSRVRHIIEDAASAPGVNLFPNWLRSR